MRRREFIASLGSAVAVCPFAAHARPSERPGIDKRRLQANCGGVSYYSGYHQFINWNWTNPDKQEQLFHAAPPTPLSHDALPRMDGEEFAIRWKGKGTMTVDWLTTGAVPFKATGSNEGTFKMGAKPGNTRYRVLTSDSADPVRDIQVFQTRYRAAMDRGELINPDYVTIAKPYKRLRFMDWWRINGSKRTTLAELPYLREIEELLSRTGSDAHICIPHLFTDAEVRKLATWCREVLPKSCTVTVEYSNEVWNWGFAQTGWCRDQAITLTKTMPAMADDYRKFYGYRATQCMAIFAEVYGPAERHRWRGCLGTQTVSDGVTKSAIAGVKLVTSTVRTLFDSLQVTGYFGSGSPAGGFQAITAGNPTVVKDVRHGLKGGEVVRLCVHPKDGMQEINGRKGVVTVINPDTFSLDIDSTGATPLVTPITNAYWTHSSVFDLMEASEARHGADPARYPTKYAYFGEQLAEACLTGKASDGFTQRYHVGNNVSTYWPMQKKLADAEGLALEMYEGGSHFVGNVYLSGYATQNLLGDRFTEYNVNVSHSSQMAKVYRANFEAFEKIGGKMGSLYTLDGPPGRYGTWGGVRGLPRALSPKIDYNPVAQASADYSLNG